MSSGCVYLQAKCTVLHQESVIGIFVFLLAFWAILFCCCGSAHTHTHRAFLVHLAGSYSVCVEYFSMIDNEMVELNGSWNVGMLNERGRPILIIVIVYKYYINIGSHPKKKTHRTPPLFHSPSFFRIFPAEIITFHRFLLSICCFWR